MRFWKREKEGCEEWEDDFDGFGRRRDGERREERMGEGLDEAGLVREVGC